MVTEVSSCTMQERHAANRKKANMKLSKAAAGALLFVTEAQEKHPSFLVLQTAAESRVSIWLGLRGLP